MAGPSRKYKFRERAKWPIVKAGYPLGLDMPRRHVPTSLTGLVHQYKLAGWEPSSCVDAGVAWGTTELQDGFPDVKQILVEPNPIFVPFLTAKAAKRDNWHFHQKAFSNKSGSVPFAIHAHEQGGYLFGEGQTNDDVVTETVEAITLDELDRIEDFGDNYFLKIDVQGHEREMLQGGTESLKRAEVVVIETAPCGATTSSEIICMMLEHGHLLSGFLTQYVESVQWRKLESIDCVFVRKDSWLLLPEAEAKAARDGQVR